ncbi:hypothetical protein ACQ4PT_050975 [Festuca glaucescens]
MLWGGHALWAGYLTFSPVPLSPALLPQSCTILDDPSLSASLPPSSSLLRARPRLLAPSTLRCLRLLRLWSFRSALSAVKVPPLWDSLGLTSAETFAEFCSLLLSRMCAVVSVLVSILECLAARCALPALLYLREVMEDGSVLAGVELELPDDGLCVGPRRKFFWGDVWRGSFDAYDQPAIQAISFLQGMYGFVIRDYNYDCMVAYRDCVRSAVVVAACAACRVGRLEREGLRPCTAASVGPAAPGPSFGSPGGQVALDWQLLGSRLMGSVRNL